MDKYIIKGNKRLKGSIKISGSKNAALPLISAAILTSGVTRLHNVPDLKDISTMLKVIEVLGAKYNFNTEKNELEIDATTIKTHIAPYELVKTMRASIYVLGPLLARIGKANVSLPGGCAIGPRPVNLHTSAMEKLGAKIKFEDGFIKARARKLKGSEIIFEKISVGATANAIMAAVLAHGTTVIKNAALEPEIEELIKFLNKMGAKISGENTDTITIKGVNKLKPIKYKVMPDRIEAGTYLIAGIITHSKITLIDVVAEHIEALIKELERMGVKLLIKNNSITIKKTKNLNSIDIKTMPYPGFPTDLQAPITPLLAVTKGISVVNETIFENRFMHIPELNRMGADIEINNNIAIIRGGKKLTGTTVMASDLRAGAALVIAGLAAAHETVIERIYHIDRGYEKLEEKLRNIGANIQRISGGK